MSHTATYHGTCDECELPIIPGELIHTVDGEWQHVDCGARAERVVCVCEKCWTTHNGECV